MPPHPSATGPQFLFWAAQVVGAQPHAPATPPPPHDSGGTHEPLLSVPPQRSGVLSPRALPSPVRVGAVGPQTWAPPPPAHSWGETQPPQLLMVPPHPSEMDPQFLPW